MIKKLTLIYFLICVLMVEIAPGQIPIHITKVKEDSIYAFIEKNIELIMGKTYTFIIKTDITQNENIEMVYNEFIPVYEGSTFKHTFLDSEWGIRFKKKNGIGFICKPSVIEILGTKFTVYVDNKKTSKYRTPIIFHKNSQIKIVLSSEVYPLNKLKVEKPIIFTWQGLKDPLEYRYLEQNSISIRLADLTKLYDYHKTKLDNLDNTKINSPIFSSGSLGLLIYLPEVYFKHEKILNSMPFLMVLE